MMDRFGKNRRDIYSVYIFSIYFVLEAADIT